MRPRSLHLAGFTAFRGPTDVDFDGVDLFALTGPTGSGKSSIIDAICFALYGSIPRLGGGAVAPVISLGKAEARIRLVFEVEGTEYKVSRLLVRQGEGATQKDVRFEGPDEVVSGVKDVDRRIEGLLGLGFDHFTRCVVLPQGRFAAFLEDSARERERLLKQLLDLGVYEEMRKRAASHAARLQGEVAAIDAQLHDLVVDPDQVEAADRRVEVLKDLRRRVEIATVEIDRLSGSLAEEDDRRRTLVIHRERLATVHPPADLEALGAVVRDATAERAAAAEAMDEARSRLERVGADRERLGEVAAIERSLDIHRRVAALAERVDKGAGVVDESEGRSAAAAATLEAATEAWQRATETVADLRRRHAAHDIRRGLTPGEPCPVCLQAVERVPDVDLPAGMVEAEAAAAETAERRRAAAEALQEAETVTATHIALLEQLRSELSSVETAGLPTVEQLEARLEEARALDAALVEARAAAEAAADRLAEADRRVERAETAGRTASEELDRARDRVAVLGPPAPARVDVTDDWTALIAWSREQDRELAAAVALLDESTGATRARVEELRKEVAAQTAAAGLAPTGGDSIVAVVEALTRAEETASRLRSDLGKSERLRSRRAELERDRGGYDELSKLLKSNRFQQWLIQEALVGLIEFANVQLAELAGGAYSLVVTGGDFEVIDHRNAEARRSVRTLSGGETFLVSLALALALAERVVATSAVGTARIESMFLDEGFGTLDAETLDTVAAVVQELGTRDRMIGLVTHVRELAEQIPTRFEVRKLPDGATVRRVDG